MSAELHGSFISGDFTKLNEDGRDVPVGDLAREAGVSNPRSKWNVDTEPYVFLSHTGKDNVKEEIARPTHWFLTNHCAVKAFLDDSSTQPGMEKSLALLEPAYRCTHALVLLSPTFRSRRYCVQELNTFVSRFQQETDGSFHLIPALWMLSNTRGYADFMHELIWLKDSENAAAGDYMVFSLWPRLRKELGLEPMHELALEEMLVKYENTHRGQKRAIPACLESFVNGSDIPREIITRRCWQLESYSDFGVDLDSLTLHVADSVRSSSSTIPSLNDDTLYCRVIKQFWKEESPEGRLVQIPECTVSRFAPFTVGAPWLKAKIHLQERKKMEKRNYKAGQAAKVNAKLAVTAGQMVLREHEFEGFTGCRYLGLYQAIVRNSIPLFVTTPYYQKSLSRVFDKHETDAIQAKVVGEVVRLPQEFCDAFADYMADEEIGTDVIQDKKKKLHAIVVGDEGTRIEYIKKTAYLDGDIWVAAEGDDAYTSFRSRFCNLADREDLGTAVEDLRREIEDLDLQVVYQFDQVDKRFDDGEAAIISHRQQRMSDSDTR